MKHFYTIIFMLIYGLTNTQAQIKNILDLGDDFEKAFEHDECANEINNYDDHYKLIIHDDENANNNFVYQILRYKSKGNKIVNISSKKNKSLKVGLPLNVWMSGDLSKYEDVEVNGTHADFKTNESEQLIEEDTNGVNKDKGGISAFFTPIPGVLPAARSMELDTLEAYVKLWDDLTYVLSVMKANHVKESQRICIVNYLESEFDTIAIIEDAPKVWREVINKNISSLSSAAELSAAGSQAAHELSKGNDLLPNALKAYEVFKLIKEYSELRKLKLSTYTVVDNYDFLEFDIKYKLKGDGEKEKSAKPFKYYIRGGFTSSISAGVMVHGLTNKQYHLSPVTISDTTFFTENGIVNKDSVLNVTEVSKQEIKTGTASDTTELRKNFNVGISTLANFYFRTGMPINFALSTGVGFDLDDDTQVNVRILAGASIILGRKTQFAFGGGCVLGKIDVLGDTNYIGQQLEMSVMTVPHTSEWDKSWYFNFSMNIPIGKSSKGTDLSGDNK